ncbi:MAG: hypothetical protein V1720_00630 [bacterium]
MFVPVMIFYLFICAVLLLFGLLQRSLFALIILNILWWISSLISAIMVAVAFSERFYSENWAMIFVLYFSFPFIIVSAIMIIIELIYLKKKNFAQKSFIKVSSIALLFFLGIQVFFGLMSFHM